MGLIRRTITKFQDPDHQASNRIKKGIRTLFQFGILTFLGVQLFEIGLVNVLTSLPVHPLFYLLFLVNYFSIPAFELWIYRKKWDLTISTLLPAFLRKKVLNMDVVGYSGEVYLYMWVKKQLKTDAKEALLYIKDNNILSSVASTFVTFVLLFVYIQLGSINPADYLGTISFWNKIFIVVGIAVVTLLIYRFRKLILSITIRESLTLFSLHAFRIVFINVVQILQWGVAEPEITLAVWFTFSAVQNLAARIPFLPSTDALFATIALNMTGLVEAPQDVIAGLLTANLLLMRGMNLLVFLFIKPKGDLSTGEEVSVEMMDDLHLEPNEGLDVQTK